MPRCKPLSSNWIPQKGTSSTAHMSWGLHVDVINSTFTK